MQCISHMYSTQLYMYTNLVNRRLLILWGMFTQDILSINLRSTYKKITHRLNLELNDSLEILIFKQIETTVKC